MGINWSLELLNLPCDLVIFVSLYVITSDFNSTTDFLTYFYIWRH